MTECEEVAESIWKNRQVPAPIEPISAPYTRESIDWLVNDQMPSESATVRANVSEALFRLAVSAGMARE